MNGSREVAIWKSRSLRFRARLFEMAHALVLWEEEAQHIFLLIRTGKDVVRS
jgi:hypothetical protein